MKIGIIPTYHDMVITAEKLRQRPGIQFMISEATYDEGVREAERMRREGADVIISRGATLNYIEQQCAIPTVNCAYGAMDLIYALQIAKNFGRHIGVITYAPVPVDERVIVDLFQTEITFTSGYDNPQRNLRCVMEMKEQGIDVVVGGGVTVRMAQMNGMKNVLITTRPETLENAVDEAFHMMEIIQRDKLELEEISQIIRYASEAILLTDLSGNIMMANRGGEELLNEFSDGRAIRSLGELPQLQVLLDQVHTGRAYRSELVSVGETMLLCSQYPILISGRLMGVALFLQHSAKIQKLEQSIRTRLYKKPGPRYTLDSFIGQNESIRKCRQMARTYAGYDSTVLIIGESGTGKEIMAQSIHNLSSRRDEPFVAVNCNAIESTLLDSELFGYTEGAFTGAKKRGKAGLFELAHRGTIFLDEIGSVSKNLQSKLLRVIQEKEVWRIGSDNPIPVDVRILAATNSDLCLKVQRGEFRLDLFYRLCVLDLRLPPLRDRPDDIPRLLKYFCGLRGLDPSAIPEKIVQEMMEYEWPGNVRELQNFVERFSLLYPNLQAEDVWRSCLTTGRRIYGAAEAAGGERLTIRKGSLQDMTDQLILKMYEECGQNKSALADTLGVSRGTVLNRLGRLLDEQEDDNK